jgi:hypothetical protein
MTSKWVIIGCGSLAAVFIIVVAVAMYFALKSTSSLVSGMAKMTREPEIPADLRKPRVLVGDGLLASKPVYKHSRLGSISCIARGKLDGGSSDEIGVAAPRGAAILNKDFSERSYVQFFSFGRSVDVVDVEGDGVCEYLNKGGYGYFCSLLDHAGKTLWTSGGMGASMVEDAEYGDVDGDGKPEFAVAVAAGFRDGVALLDSRGKRKWFFPEMYLFRVLMADTDCDGKAEVVYSDPYQNIVVRDAAGDLVSREKPEASFTGASCLIPWPARSDRKRLLLSDKGKFWVVGFDGNTIATIDAPNLSKEGWDLLAAFVRLKSGEPDYLAVLINYGRWDRSVLYLYSHDKKLVYEEVMPESRDALIAAPSDDGKTEALLLGGEDWVWRYEAAGTGSKGK